MTESEDLSGITTRYDENSDDSESQQDEKNEEWIDIVGDIEAKLRGNKLKYATNEIKERDYQYINTRKFENALIRFEEKYHHELDYYYPFGEKDLL